MRVPEPEAFEGVPVRLTCSEPRILGDLDPLLDLLLLLGSKRRPKAGPTLHVPSEPDQPASPPPVKAPTSTKRSPKPRKRSPKK